MHFFGIYDDVDGTAEEAEESKKSCGGVDVVDHDDDDIQRG